MYPYKIRELPHGVIHLGTQLLKLLECEGNYVFPLTSIKALQLTDKNAVVTCMPCLARYETRR